MYRLLARFPIVLVLFAMLGGAAVAQTNDAVAAATSGKTSLPGYFPMYWDDAAGRLLLVVDRWDTEFLYISSLAAGVGSNDLGLDRGQLGAQRIVFFRKLGRKCC